MCTCKYISPPHLTTLHLMQILQMTQKYTKQMDAKQNQITHNWEEHAGLLNTSAHHQVTLFQNQTKKPKFPQCTYLLFAAMSASRDLPYSSSHSSSSRRTLASSMFIISPRFTDIVSQLSLLCPLPERHVLYDQLNQVLLNFNYLASKANSPVKHQQSTDFLLLDCHKAALQHTSIHILYIMWII